MNMVDVVEQTNLNIIFFLRGFCWIWPFVHKKKKKEKKKKKKTTIFLQLISAGRILENFDAYIASIKIINLHWVFECGLKD